MSRPNRFLQKCSSFVNIFGCRWGTQTDCCCRFRGSLRLFGRQMFPVRRRSTRQMRRNSSGASWPVVGSKGGGQRNNSSLPSDSGRGFGNDKRGGCGLRSAEWHLLHTHTHSHTLPLAHTHSQHSEPSGDGTDFHSFHLSILRHTVNFRHSNNCLDLLSCMKTFIKSEFGLNYKTKVLFILISA